MGRPRLSWDGNHPEMIILGYQGTCMQISRCSERVCFWVIGRITSQVNSE